MKKSILFAAVLLLVLSFSVAMAEPRGGKGGKDFGREGKRSPYADLNLTEEQKGKIDTWSETMRKELAPIRTELIKKRMELDLLWMEDSPDAVKVKAKQREIRELRGKMEDTFTDFRLNVNSVLTPEQRSELMLRKSQKKRSFRHKRDQALE